MDDAPCHQPGTKPNPCARALFEFLVHGCGSLGGPWQGWRLAGRHLVSPEGDRVTVERLRGLLWAERTASRLRRTRTEDISRCRGQVAPTVQSINRGHSGGDEAA